MTTKQALYLGVSAVVIAAVWAGAVRELGAQQPASATVPIDSDDIGGVVSGPNGPEAGVWVIAETTELPTRFARIVATDDQGRYVVPDLPKARYKVWVRGYGLVDSPKDDGELGKPLNLRRCRRRTRQQRRSTIRRSTGTRCSRSRSWSVRRQEQHPREHHPERLAHRGEESRLHRLSPAGATLHAHHPRGVWPVRFRRKRVDSPGAVGQAARSC